ncbi:hypothetical protein BGZ65_002189 [Modicella reniformis]|uniref:Uncharacterized protein n=1 Tax=Modicella reniformis TaxID=1440133 RepID=A0A9P6M0J0_9FUNG|nr:hypothetical protein BGZ65_002189 [Modicella reniformis]
MNLFSSSTAGPFSKANLVDYIERMKAYRTAVKENKKTLGFASLDKYYVPTSMIRTNAVELQVLPSICASEIHHWRGTGYLIPELTSQTSSSV